MSKELPPIIIHLPKIETTPSLVINEDPKEYYLPKSVKNASKELVKGQRLNNSDKRAVTIIERKPHEQSPRPFFSKSTKNLIKNQEEKNEHPLTKSQKFDKQPVVVAEKEKKINPIQINTSVTFFFFSIKK
jgi:hypothetical protein